MHAHVCRKANNLSRLIALTRYSVKALRNVLVTRCFGDVRCNTAE